MPLRKPAVAGTFYPAQVQELESELKRCLSTHPTSKEKVIGVVSPHAGYIYSGVVAGAVFSKIEIPDKLIILSPNHTGLGSPFSIMPEGEWETPLGRAKIDQPLASLFMKNCPLLEIDQEAHRREHSLEVQIPFLQHLKKAFSFVPVTLGHIPFEDCETVGQGLAATIRKSGEEILIIASSDMNHYESQGIAEKKDQIAIQQILKLDPKRLFDKVHQSSVSMCGIIPTTVMLIAAKELGAKKAELIKHATSGDVTGDYNSVVGYASLMIS
ncbi:MAG: AmmeMemoRadiSam system protein B [Deltaproteobacteria bacterium]|nr:AmmeMemoRadiSam system protein B [Deltaproteobacteria bacterium]